MNKYLILLLFSAFSFAQKLTVAELQLKLAPGATEELYYAFDAGDRILLNIDVAEGKALEEVSVIEYPDNYKFRGHEVKKEKNKIFIVSHKAVYQFRFSNSSKEQKVCNIKIQRAPAKQEGRSFNTTVEWATRQDTVWNTYTKDVITGYDTVYTQKTRRVPAYEKRYEEVVLDKSARVSSKATLGECKSSVSFTLPADVSAKDETKKVVAWAYWVGVGEESNEFWKQNRKMIVGAVQSATTMFTSPLGGIAAGTLTNLVLPVNGEDVEYALVNEANSKLFFQDASYKYFDKGKGIAAYKRFIDPKMLQGKYYIVLANDNYVQPIDVNVKVSAIIEHIKYKDEKYTDRTVTPRYEKKIVREPQIVTKKYPVFSK